MATTPGERPDGRASARPRLFIAVELPHELRAALAALQEELRRHVSEGLRWVRPDGIHLTLKFLGETPAGSVPAIQQAIARAAAAAAPHTVALGGLGTFGSVNRPQVLWIALTGDVEELSVLQQQVEGGLEPLGFSREQRPFAPHLTLARVRPESARAVAAPLREALDAVRPPLARLDVREVSLMRSFLRLGGAVYQAVATFPLGGR